MKIQVAPNLRTYDNNGYRLRAGCLCYKDESEKELLLVTSSRDTSSWVVPAGGIDQGEDALEAAVREVHEEAGVLGDIGACLGVFQDDQRKTLTYIYSMVVRKMVSPLDQKDRKWFKIKDAIIKLNHRPTQQSYITTTINTNTNGSHNYNVVNTSNIVRGPLNLEKCR